MHIASSVDDRFGSAAQGYLDTPTMGLPTVATVEAVHDAVDEWLSGQARFDIWEESTERCRQAWARLSGADPALVGTVPSVVSSFASVFDALARGGGDVVVHRDEFRSLLLPALAAFGPDRVRWVDGDYAAESFARAIDAGVAAVAICSVASGNGARPDLAAVVSAADTHGARVVVDSTQSEGIVGLGPAIERFAAVATAGYKGLLGPRGTGYVFARDDLGLAPIVAASPYGMADGAARGSYGGPAVPHPGGRGLTQSPAWLSWIGAVPGLEHLAGSPAQEREDAVLALADTLRDGLHDAGVRTEPSDLRSSIVSVPVHAPDAVLAALARAGIRAAARLGRLRLGLHIYTSPATVDTALAVLTSLSSEHYERI